MPEQIEAVTGRRLRRPYQSMITAQAPHLPEIYAAREAKQFQAKQVGQRAREFDLAEKGQRIQEEQSKRATILGAASTGAMIGSAFSPAGAAIGGAIGLVGGWISTQFM